MSEIDILIEKKAEEFIQFLKCYKVEAIYNHLPGIHKYPKIFIPNHGNLVLYYSLKKGYTLTNNEIKTEEMKPFLSELWNKFQQKEISKDVKVDINHNYKIYVDGSFIANNIGYGYVILKEDKIENEGWGSLYDFTLRRYNQIGGEIRAVLESLKWCKDNNVQVVDLFYDYSGLELWATHKWKANSRLTQEYQNNFNDNQIFINWIKVKSHTNDKWNDYVDQLAKKGALSKIVGGIDNHENKICGINKVDEVDDLRIYLESHKITFKRDNSSPFQSKFTIKDLDNAKTYVRVTKNGKGKITRYEYAENISNELKNTLNKYFTRENVQLMADPFSAFNYYYKNLYKYRNCNFDFTLLSKELNKIASKYNYGPIHLDISFTEIESHLKKLKELYNGNA